MTCVSEQGKSGLLWTVFEGDPFCSRRIASFANADDAREYMGMKGIKLNDTWYFTPGKCKACGEIIAPQCEYCLQCSGENEQHQDDIDQRL